MQHPLPLSFFVQELIVSFASIRRNHYLAGQDERENDVEHSFSVAILCWLVCDQHSLGLDLTKIIKYALVHDLVEVYAGDTNTYAPAESRYHKKEREQQALLRLADELQRFPDLVTTIEAYEHKVDEESVFVWTVDKMQMLIMGSLDDWRPYKEISISYETFCAKQAEHLANSSIYAREIFKSLSDYCISTYYDQPKQPLVSHQG